MAGADILSDFRAESKEISATFPASWWLGCLSFSTAQNQEKCNWCKCLTHAGHCVMTAVVCVLKQKEDWRTADEHNMAAGRHGWIFLQTWCWWENRSVPPFFSLSFCPCWLLVDFCPGTRAGGGGNETENDEKVKFIGCVFFADKKWARNFILVVISETADMRAAGCKWPSLWTSSAVFHAEWTRLPCHLLCRRPLALFSSVSQIEYHCNRLSVTRLEYWIFFWYLIEYFTECVGLFSAVSSILFPLNIFFLLNILRSSLARPLRMHYEI